MFYEITLKILYLWYNNQVKLNLLTNHLFDFYIYTHKNIYESILMMIEINYISVILCIKFFLNIKIIKLLLAVLFGYCNSFCLFKLLSDYFSYFIYYFKSFSTILNIIMYSYCIFFLLLIYFFPKNDKFVKCILKNSFYTIIRFYKEIEKELITLDDIFLIIIVLIVIFGWFFFLCLFPADIHVNVFAYIFFMIPFMVFFSLFIPFFILYDQGFFFLTYLRGTASNAIFLIELIYDYLAVLVLFIRIIIQNLRFFFIFLVYVEVQEHLNSMPEMYYTPWPDPYLGEAGVYLYLLPRTIWWFFIYKLPNIIILSIYYIGHLYVIFISHTIAYVFIVFWLYLIFYTCFFTIKFEKFFKKRLKKYTKLK